MSGEHTFPPPLLHDYRIDGGRLHTRSLEAHVVDDCNLTCAECCSLSPVLRRWRIDPVELARDVSLAARVLAPRVFKLVGGEPLLHPDIVELIDIVRRAGIAPRVSITTNGVLLPRMPDGLWRSVDALTVSVYPAVAIDRELIEARAAQFGVPVNWKQQTEFVVMNRATPTSDAGETAAIYGRCWLRERCHMLRDSRFYTCTRPPHFHSFHGGALDFTRDGLLLDGATPERLLAYLVSDQPLAACAHCFGGDAPMVAHRLLTREELLRVRR